MMSEEEQPLQGYLEKQGASGIFSKKWHRRWFKQDGQQVTYSISSKHVNHQGVIDLSQISEVRSLPCPPANPSKPPTFPFNVVVKTAPAGTLRIFSIRAGSEKERQYWLDGFNALKAKYEGQPPLAASVTAVDKDGGGGDHHHHEKAPEAAAPAEHPPAEHPAAEHPPAEHPPAESPAAEAPAAVEAPAESSHADEGSSSSAPAPAPAAAPAAGAAPAPRPGPAPFKPEEEAAAEEIRNQIVAATEGFQGKVILKRYYIRIEQVDRTRKDPNNPGADIVEKVDVRHKEFERELIIPITPNEIASIDLDLNRLREAGCKKARNLKITFKFDQTMFKELADQFQQMSDKNEPSVASSTSFEGTTLTLPNTLFNKKNISGIIDKLMTEVLSNTFALEATLHLKKENLHRELQELSRADPVEANNRISMALQHRPLLPGQRGGPCPHHEDIRVLATNKCESEHCQNYMCKRCWEKYRVGFCQTCTKAWDPEYVPPPIEPMPVAPAPAAAARPAAAAAAPAAAPAAEHGHAPAAHEEAPAGESHHEHHQHEEHPAVAAVAHAEPHAAPVVAHEEHHEHHHHEHHHHHHEHHQHEHHAAPEHPVAHVEAPAHAEAAPAVAQVDEFDI